MLASRNGWWVTEGACDLQPMTNCDILIGLIHMVSRNVPDGFVFNRKSVNLFHVSSCWCMLARHGMVQVTYRFFHWKKGTPFAEDQGDYAKLTWWEQVDNGRQHTRNRKFLIVVPVLLYLLLYSSSLPELFAWTSFILVFCMCFFPTFPSLPCVFNIHSWLTLPISWNTFLGVWIA